MFFVWSVSEGCIIIMAASMPPLAPLIRKRRRSSTYQRAYELDESDRPQRRAVGKPPETTILSVI
jgi:hypothetical protein